MGYIWDLSMDFVILSMFFNCTASIAILMGILTTYTSIVATDEPFQGIKIHF